ncbi:DUF3105 domain-containing protein [Longispora sp. K20-0274]|uniref:DUF3105 domain-containing protein n=1 Tax=Longispora sp. K20-0274 TaxID=3088255 RepID=UPI00399AAA1A
MTVGRPWGRIGYYALVLTLFAACVAVTRQNWAAQLVGSTVSAAPAGRDLPGTELPMLPSPHIPYLGAEHAAYNSLPATSGPHLPWPAASGVYRESVPDELMVHSLEHGHVAVQYAPDTPAGQVALLEDIARRYPAEVVAAPYPRLGHGVALTAWCRLQTLDSVDEAAIVRFVEALAGRYDHGWTR